MSSSTTSSAPDPTRSPEVRAIAAAIEALVGSLFPDAAVPLETQDVYQGSAAVLASFGLDATLTADYTPNTLRFYRRSGVVSAPEGRTTRARYTRRHIYEAVLARLVGHLALANLREAAALRATFSDDALPMAVAVRVREARSREALRQGRRESVGRSFEAPPPNADVCSRRSTAGASAGQLVPAALRTIALPGGAFFVLPEGHGALHDLVERETLITAVRTALTRGRPRPEAMPTARPLPR
jgi:hypothetical protein